MTDDYFMRVDNHVEIRTAALESSKLIVHSSQAYYRIMELRKHKKELYSTLKEQLVDLLNECKDLQDVLPYHELAKVVKKQPSKKKTTKKAATKKTTKKSTKKTATKKTTKKSTSELDKLNEALAMIEEKLQTLA